MKGREMDARTAEQTPEAEREEARGQRETSERTMPCPNCGASMPDLKGGKATICPVCGFKDSCCF